LKSFCYACKEILIIKNTFLKTKSASLSVWHWNHMLCNVVNFDARCFVKHRSIVKHRYDTNHRKTLKNIAQKWSMHRCFFTSLYCGQMWIWGSSGGDPSVWQHYELLHSFLGAYHIHNLDQNTLKTESMSHSYICGLKWSNKMYLLQILGNTLWSYWM